MRAHVDSITIARALRDVSLWAGVLVGALLGGALAIFMPPVLIIVMGGLALWLVLRRRAGHQPSLMLVGLLIGVAIMVCLAVVSILVHQGTPTTGHGTGKG